MSIQFRASHSHASGQRALAGRRLLVVSLSLSLTSLTSPCSPHLSPPRPHFCVTRTSSRFYILNFPPCLFSLLSPPHSPHVYRSPKPLQHYPYPLSCFFGSFQPDLYFHHSSSLVSREFLFWTYILETEKAVNAVAPEFPFGALYTSTFLERDPNSSLVDKNGETGNPALFGPRKPPQPPSPAPSNHLVDPIIMATGQQREITQFTGRPNMIRNLPPPHYVFASLI